MCVLNYCIDCCKLFSLIYYPWILVLLVFIFVSFHIVPFCFGYKCMLFLRLLLFTRSWGRCVHKVRYTFMFTIIIHLTCKDIHIHVDIGHVKGIFIYFFLNLCFFWFAITLGRHDLYELYG